MAEYELITLPMIMDFLTKNKSNNISCLGVCPVSELLFATEMIKKKGVNVGNLDNLLKDFTKIDGLEIAEIERNDLDYMFKDDYNNTEIWDKAINSKIEPRISLGLLAIKAFALNNDSEYLLDRIVEEHFDE